MLFDYTFLNWEICNAQNLVPNPSFEVYDTCPNNLSQTRYLSDWNVPIYQTTPDYFNACDSLLAQNAGVPNNYFGWEPAHTGSAYAGVITYFPAPNPLARNYREYIQVELTDTLVAGIDYYVHCYWSTADSVAYTTNNMGIYFSNIEIHDTCNPPCNLPYTPQIENPTINNMNTIIGWTKLSGHYIALGGEKFIIIGNFDDTTSTFASPTGWSVGKTWAYYYIDDVCVSTDSFTCNSPVGINEIKNEEDLILFPNPFSDNLTITTKTNQPTEIILYDITSRILLQQTFTNTTTINTSHLASGMYIYEVRNNKEVIKQGKVVKE